MGGDRSRRPPNLEQVVPESRMKAPASAHVQEPVGIVITHSTPAEKPSVFSAYVWGPAPEETPPKAG